MVISTTISLPLITAVQSTIGADPGVNRTLRLLFLEGTTELVSIDLNTFPNTVLDVTTNNSGILLGPGGLTIIAGTVGVAGTVNTFKILFEHATVPASNIDFFVGSVGSLSSDADIRFSQTAWELSASIVINNLTLIVPLEP